MKRKFVEQFETSMAVMVGTVAVLSVLVMTIVMAVFG